MELETRCRALAGWRLYMPKPNTVTMQYMDLLSQRTVRLPSVVLSQ